MFVNLASLFGIWWKWKTVLGHFSFHPNKSPYSGLFIFGGHNLQNTTNHLVFFYPDEFDVARRLCSGNEGFQVVAGFIRGLIFPEREDQRCEKRSWQAARLCVTMPAVEGELKSKNEMCFSKDTSPLSFFWMKSVLTGLTYSLGLASHSEDEI